MNVLQCKRFCQPGLGFTAADPSRYLVWCTFPLVFLNFVLNFTDANEFLRTEIAADVLSSKKCFDGLSWFLFPCSRHVPFVLRVPELSSPAEGGRDK